MLFTIKNCTYLFPGFFVGWWEGVILIHTPAQHKRKKSNMMSTTRGSLYQLASLYLFYKQYKLVRKIKCNNVCIELVSAHIVVMN